MIGSSQAIFLKDILREYTVSSLIILLFTKLGNREVKFKFG